MHSWNAGTIAAAALLLLPALTFAFAGESLVRAVNRLSAAGSIAIVALAAVPYYLAAHDSPQFHWGFVALYALLPVILVALLDSARRRDPEQRGSRQDFAVLAALGLLVEFRLLEPAWPEHFRSLGRLLLFDVGLYGFLAVRQLTQVGFHFVPRWRDWKIGFRELAFYAPIAIPLGLGLGFLHFHAILPRPAKFALTWISIFAFVAILEETYFRGWVQNLLQRRMGRRWSLLATAILFGLSHFNKGAAHFNWRYVLMATFAGIFYGRAWREERRLVASAITHASVDAIWSIWLR